MAEISNAEIAARFAELADLLDLTEANPFRVRAWREAARFLQGYGEPLERQVEAGADLTSLPRIGKDIAHAIEELVKTGRFEALEGARREVPPDMVRLLRVPGLGPKRVRRLWKELGLTTVEDVERAASEGRIAALSGFSEKLQTQIHDGLLTLDAGGAERRFRLDEVDGHVRDLRAHLDRAPGLQRLDVAGSYRRRRDTVGDLDVLAEAPAGRPVTEHLAGWARVAQVVGLGDTRATVVLDDGLQVDLRVVAAESYGAALVYFTGSKDHGVALRRRAIARGLKLSEYGVFRGEARVAGRTEEEVYAAVDLPWIPPELREARGEIEAAEAGALPALVERGDLRGDLLARAPGREAAEALARACLERGYAFVAFVAPDPSSAREHGRALEALAARFPRLRLLRGLEVDVRRDGALDAPDAALEAHDVVRVAVRRHPDLPPAQQTKRLLAALAHPRAQILADPFAGLDDERPPLNFDLDAVLHACRERGVAVEFGARPARLDVDEVHLRRARDLGVKAVLSTGAGAVEGLDDLRWGVDRARRGWLRSEDVLNTLSVEAFLRALRG